MSAFTNTDQNLSLNHAPFDCREFQSLPNSITTDSYNVHAGQVEPFSLSLLSCNQLLESPVAWYGEQQQNQQPASASFCSASEHVAPIPSFVSSASYDDGTFLCNKSTHHLKSAEKWS